MIRKVSVVIVNHNNKDLLRDALTSLQRQKGVSLEIIVVDNQSTDDTSSMLKRDFPDIKVITRDSAFGFASANNLGVAASRYDTILFCNPDIKIEDEHVVSELYDRLMGDEHIGAITPKVVLALRGTVDETCHRGFPTPWRAFCHFSKLSTVFRSLPLFTGYYQKSLGYDNTHFVEAIGGMFMLMRKADLAMVGGWDEDYKLYGEDLDLCYRLSELGLKCQYYAQVQVLHYKGASTGMSKHSREITTASRETTRRVKAYSIEAMQLFYTKHYQGKYPFYVTWLVKLGIGMLYLIRVKLQT